MWNPFLTNTIMGIFDFLFANKKEKKRLQAERLAEQERIRLAEEKRIAAEREKRLADNRRKEEERLAKIKALQESSSNPANFSVKKIAQGGVFEASLFVSVIKQVYNGESTKVNTDANATASVKRTTPGGNITISFSNLSELKSKGLIQSNLDLAPAFSYNEDESGDEFASAEINNSFDALNSGKEFISLFQITKQSGEIISFLINNLPDVEDYYYLIMLREKK